MTLAEKQELRKLIQHLPPKNLDRIVEIVQRSKPPDSHPCNEIYIDLEKEVNLKQGHHVTNEFQIHFLFDNCDLNDLLYYGSCRIMQHYGDCITMLKRLQVQKSSHLSRAQLNSFQWIYSSDDLSILMLT